MSSSQVGQAFQQIQGGAQGIQNQAVGARDNVLSKMGINPPSVGAPPPLTLPDQSVDVGFRGGAIAPFSYGPTTPETAMSPPGSYNSGQAYRRGAQDYFRNDLAGDPQARSQAAFDALQQRNPDMAARLGSENVGMYLPQQPRPFMGGPSGRRGLLRLPAER